MAPSTESDLAMAPAASLEARILEAAIRCIARWGMAKTTVDDIAREASCGRASVYRVFPGGKADLLEAAATYEEGRLFADLADRLDAALTLEGLLVEGLHGAACHVRDSSALQYLLAHEPEAVLPKIAFDRIGPLLYRCTAYVAPYLERFVAADQVAEVAEWGARLVLSYSLAPSEHLDLCNRDDASRFVRIYLMPGLGPGIVNLNHSKGSGTHVND
jgi:AcrR family transcriptional regulator